MEDRVGQWVNPPMGYSCKDRTKTSRSFKCLLVCNCSMALAESAETEVNAGRP
jgi:hypothetical protein